ncbi:MAG: ABC transporter permease [Edaphobacter sp.]|uniref:ABC transporter permease n=1 Tax=Edaphobacter sp. TaxID=1934404 RepID=UPI00238FE22B|nr:ABC transporter permease [Edaphobacter sp.]MDE1177551.1 ABC transporter permease [Edaphobacter sp.]
MIRERISRFRFFLRRDLLARRRTSELDEELQFHLELAIAAKMAQGMTPEGARREALIEFGGVEQAREQCQEQEPGWWIDTLRQDMRYALRGFRRNPIFALSVIATLSLGIGSTTAVFSVVDRILFRSLPYTHDDHLVSVGMVHSLEKQEFMMGSFFFDWRDNQKPFESMAIQGTMPHACDLIENNPAQLDCLYFDEKFLPLLGISPVLGRNFLSEEDRPNGPRVVIISYGLWKGHYNLDTGIIGRLIDIDGSPARVVGVLPKDFQFPTLQSADVIFPMALDRAAQATANGGFGTPMRTFARLKPGVSITQAREEMVPLFEHTRDTSIPLSVRKDVHLSIRSLRDRETQDMQLTAWILLGSVLAVLLIAYTNVAGLMMARGEARERELAVRSALGASRTRLIRQRLTEATLLSLAGAVVGLALAAGLLRIFIDLAPTGIPFLERAGLDFRIALFTILLSLVCGALFGLLPALQRPRTIALAARAAKTSKSTVLRRSLVVVQIAVSMVLLSGSALLLKSFQNIEKQNLGMQPDGVFTVRIALPGFRYNTSQKEMDFYLRAETAIRHLPGIRAVAISDSVPPGGWQGGGRSSDLVVEGKPKPEQGPGEPLAVRTITPEYFQSLNIPIIRGRNFSEADRGSKESPMIISRLLATRLFPDEDPIGRRVHSGYRHTAWYTVVGVADNVKNGGLVEPDTPEFYFLRHSAAEDWGGRAPLLIVDSVLSPEATVSWVRSQIAQLDPTVPVATETLNEQVTKLADRPRFATALLGCFAFTGLLMAVVGLYGVISFMATQRTQEIGVRMALGATRADILKLISGEGVRLIVAGGVIGLALSMATAQLLKSLLYEVKPRDPAIYAVATSLLALVAIAATLVPARAAMKVEPTMALRYE